MRQSIYLLFALSVFLSVKAQDHEVTMYFADGTDVSGYATLKFVKESFYGIPKDKIAFKVAPEDEAELWDDETISRIVFHGFEPPVVFEYIPVIYVDGTQASLFQVVDEGEISLYAEAAGVYDIKTNEIKVPEPRALRVKRSTEKEFANLSNKKKAIAYFKGCQGAIDKLESGEFNCKLPADIVTYYNENCGNKGVTENDKASQKNTAPVGE